MRHIQLIQRTFTQVRMATGKTVTGSALSRVTSVTRNVGRSSARTQRAPAWTRSWTGQRRRRSWASTRSRAARGRVWGRPSCAATPAATAASSAGTQTPPSVSQSGKTQKRYVDILVKSMSEVKMFKDWSVVEEVMRVCLHPVRQQVRGPVWAGPVPGGGAVCQRAREG